MATKQEIFDVVVLGLAAQNWEQCADRDGCKYRLEKEGRKLKCAAGQLVPDEDYTPEFDECALFGTQAYHAHFAHDQQDTVAGKYFASKYDADTCMFIVEAQGVHDGASPGDLREEFETFAKKMELSWPINQPVQE